MSTGIDTCDYLVIVHTCSFLDLVRGLTRALGGAKVRSRRATRPPVYMINCGASRNATVADALHGHC